jgi:hypothetical protein
LTPRKGQGDFVAIHPAVLTANDGDTVLVRPGQYAPFGLVGKAISVLGRPGAVARPSVHLPDRIRFTKDRRPVTGRVGLNIWCGDEGDISLSLREERCSR